MAMGVSFQKGRLLAPTLEGPGDQAGGGAPGNVSPPPQVRGYPEDLRPPHLAADAIIRAAAFPF